MATEQEIRIEVGDEAVGGVLTRPEAAEALYVLAHGAGAGMRHRFLAQMTALLAERNVATLRYNLLYMEQGKKRPDPPARAQAAVRAAVERAGALEPGLTLIAGGKSFGGRMTSGAQAAAPMTDVRGLAFLGFPLHAPGKPGTERAEHMRAIDVPMLFLQGTRDAFAREELIAEVVEGLGATAMLHWIPDADHSFGVPKRSGRTGEAVMAELADAIAAFARTVR